MALAEQQKQRGSSSMPTGRTQPPKSGPGGPKGTVQAKMPPGRTWLWLLGILLANYLLMRFLFAEPGGADHSALHALQGGGRQGQRRGDLQPGRDHHGPLQDAGHLPAGGRKECGARRVQGANRRAQPKRDSRARPAPKNGEHLHDHTALLRRPGARSIPDRPRGRDQRRADRRRRQACGRRCSSASARRCSSSASTSGCSGGRRSRAAAWRRAHGHRQEQGAPLRPGDRTRRSPSTTSPASTKPRTSWSRSSIS